MIKNAIESILGAEEQAENIIKEANVKAHKIVADSKKYQNRHKEDTRVRLSKEAEEEYQKAAASGDKEAEGIFKHCQKNLQTIQSVSERNAQKTKQYIRRRLLEI